MKAGLRADLMRRAPSLSATRRSIWTCVEATITKCPRRKPSGGMLREALAHYHVAPADTPFVGDQADDLKAAFHAGCKRVLVRTGLGSKTLAEGLPQYLSPVAVHDDLAAVVSAQLAGKL